MAVLFAAICFSFIAVALTEALYGEKAPVRRAFFRILCGVLLLYAANVLSPITGIETPISLLTVGISSALGVPGAALVIALHALFI